MTHEQRALVDFVSYVVAIITASVIVMLVLVFGGCAFHARGTPGPRLLEAQYSYSERVEPNTQGAISTPNGWFREGLKPWTRNEMVITGMALGCLAVDLVTTHVGSGEANPINSTRNGKANWSVILPIHVALPTFAWWLGERTGRRATSWAGIMVAECSISAWNLGQLK